MRKSHAFAAAVALALPGCSVAKETAEPVPDASLADAGRARDGGFLDLDAGTRADVGIVVDENGWASVDGFDCPLKVAVRADTFPPPIRWVDCSSAIGLPAGACQRMALDFPDLSPSGYPVTTSGARANQAGKIEYGFKLFHPKSMDWYGVDGDGAVRTFLHMESLACGMGSNFGPVDGKFVTASASDAVHATAIVGAFGEVPHVLRSYTGNFSWFPTRLGPLEWAPAAVTLYDWSGAGPSRILVGSGQDARSDLIGITEVGSRLYAKAGSKYNVYEYPASGPRAVVLAGRDVPNEVGSYAALPDRMFWTNIEPIPESGGLQYRETALYTQALGTDGLLTGVRQRLPSPSPLGYSKEAKMGCNKLARVYLEPPNTPGPSGSGLEVFDFANLRHWRIPSPSNVTDTTQVFSAVTIHDVTCGEVAASLRYFDRATNRIQATFGRFDLTKLGPGEPFATIPDPIP
jgi:hypothetical protein